MLLEADISYELLVAVMDKVRVGERAGRETAPFRTELFPEISIGDAPVLN